MSKATACSKCRTKGKHYCKACEFEQETKEKDISGPEVRWTTTLEQDLRLRQIEKMADCQSCYNNLGKCPMKDKTKCPDYKVAMRQYDQGLRKITDESVVLPKEVYERLKVPQQDKNWIYSSIIICENAKAEARKEVVNKLVEMIIKEHGCNPLTNEDDEDIEICLTASELHEICNKILEDKNL